MQREEDGGRRKRALEMESGVLEKHEPPGWEATVKDSCAASDPVDR